MSRSGGARWRSTLIANLGSSISHLSSRFRSMTSSASASPSSTTTTTAAAPVHLPSRRLEATLMQLDGAEHSRFMAAETAMLGAPEGGHFEEDDTTRAGCSYSTRQSMTNPNDNRWSNIVAYDHALLKGPYLNASFIPPFPSNNGTPSTKINDRQASPSSRRGYIASQAPLPHTLATFYHHVVQYSIGLIVNLSPFKEHGRVKAHEYWPLEPDTTFVTEKDASGTSYEVYLESAPESLYEQLEVQRYEVTVKRHAGEGQAKAADAEAHRLIILHVTSWADFGRFDEKVFAKLLDTVAEEGKRFGDSPVWVHCSAGVGRSGTVIGGLLAHDLGPDGLRRALGLSDAPATPDQVTDAAIDGAHRIVDHERRYRPLMVQTPEQLGMVAAVVGNLVQQP